MNKTIENILKIVKNNNLNIQEIDKLIDYLEMEKIKQIKISQVNQSKIIKNPKILDINVQSSRIDKRSNKNPYEYGGQQTTFEQSLLQYYDADIMRDINTETKLLQKELTHTPGQKSKNKIIDDRLSLIQYPTNVNNIVWKDNMPPRGGMTTRIDKYTN